MSRVEDQRKSEPRYNQRGCGMKRVGRKVREQPFKFRSSTLQRRVALRSFRSALFFIPSDRESRSSLYRFILFYFFFFSLSEFPDISRAFVNSRFRIRPGAAGNKTISGTQPVTEGAVARVEPVSSLDEDNAAASCGNCRGNFSDLLERTDEADKRASAYRWPFSSGMQAFRSAVSRLDEPSFRGFCEMYFVPGIFNVSRGSLPRDIFFTSPSECFSSFSFSPRSFFFFLNKPLHSSVEKFVEYNVEYSLQTCEKVLEIIARILT